MDIDEPSTSASYVPRKIDCATQTAENTKVVTLRRKVRSLSQKVRRRNIKISSMKNIIDEITNRGYGNEKLDCILKNYFGGMLQ